MQSIQIFDDDINEGREVFNVSLEVVGNISNTVEYRIQTTLCRIRQSDRKLCIMKNCCTHINRIEILVCHVSYIWWSLSAQHHYSHLSLPHCKTSTSVLVSLSAAAWPTQDKWVSEVPFSCSCKVTLDVVIIGSFFVLGINVEVDVKYHHCFQLPV